MFIIRHLLLHVSVNSCTVNKNTHKKPTEKKDVDYVKKVTFIQTYNN